MFQSSWKILQRIFFIYKKNLIIKLSSDVYIHFAIDEEIGKIAVLKKQAETLPSILNACFSIHICVEQVSMNDFQALLSLLLSTTLYVFLGHFQSKLRKNAPSFSLGDQTTAMFSFLSIPSWYSIVLLS